MGGWVGRERKEDRWGRRKGKKIDTFCDSVGLPSTVVQLRVLRVSERNAIVPCKPLAACPLASQQLQRAFLSPPRPRGQ